MESKWRLNVLNAGAQLLWEYPGGLTKRELLFAPQIAFPSTYVTNLPAISPFTARLLTYRPDVEPTLTHSDVPKPAGRFSPFPYGFVVGNDHP